MVRLKKASPLRVALLLLLGILTLDYVWVQTHPNADSERRTRNFGVWSGGNACPESVAAKPAQTAESDTLGESEYGWKLTALDGRETTLEEHRGKVVFVNVWATWCGPCVNEMPGIQALYDSTRQDGVDFVLVSEEEPSTVRKFVEQEKFSFPVFTTGQLPDKFETRGIPATFVVNREGSIVHKHQGSADWNTESCRKFLRELL